MEILAVSHVHSSWSYDGSWPIGALAETFRDRGCRVLMMTDHDRGFTQDRYAEYRAACAQASTASIQVVPGIEYSDPANRVHVLVWGPVPFLGEALQTDAVLDAVAHFGGVAVLAHPARRSAWECFKPEWENRLTGIEAWNRKYDGYAPSEASAALLGTGPYVPFVGLDFHTRRQLFPLTMALEIDGDIDDGAVVACLKERRCSPRAFGLPIDHRRFLRTLPFLQVAERTRQGLAAVKRYSRTRLPG